jgi:hypothetical protein
MCYLPSCLFSSTAHRRPALLSTLLRQGTAQAALASGNSFHKGLKRPQGQAATATNEYQNQNRSYRFTLSHHPGQGRKRAAASGTAQKLEDRSCKKPTTIHTTATRSAYTAVRLLSTTSSTRFQTKRRAAQGAQAGGDGHTPFARSLPSRWKEHRCLIITHRTHTSFQSALPIIPFYSHLRRTTR